MIATCTARNASLLTILLLSVAATAHGQIPPEWNQPQKPFQVFGNTYYVGTHGLASVLVTSKSGHVLIDGALPQSVPIVAANIRALGFRLEDIKLILNTHPHFDHAGGIAELQKLSGATVAASAASAKILETGATDKEDPQYGSLPPIMENAPLHAVHVKIFKDGEQLKAGAMTVTAHLTPGHTRGGTSWTWQSCDNGRCLNIVYADSLNPVAAEGYRYSDPRRNPNGETQFKQSFTVLSALPCDILLTPHPDFSNMFDKLTKRDANGVSDAFIDPDSCKRYVEEGRERLKKRLIGEHAG